MKNTNSYVTLKLVIDFFRDRHFVEKECVFELVMTCFFTPFEVEYRTLAARPLLFLHVLFLKLSFEALSTTFFDHFDIFPMSST